MFDKYKNPILMLSGGKDSVACLFKLKAELDNLIVVWVNTGKSFKETEDIINLIKPYTKHFVELRVNRDLQWEIYGWPADIINPLHTVEGHLYSGSQFKTQTPFNCCVMNIMLPVFKFAKEIGSTLLIKGQKNADGLKDKYKSGDMLEGITIWHPIEHWTDEQVLAAVEEGLGFLPEHFKLKHSSLDCRDCTGFVEVTQDRIAYIKDNYPEDFTELRRKLNIIRNAALGPLNDIDEVLK